MKLEGTKSAIGMQLRTSIAIMLLGFAVSLAGCGAAPSGGEPAVPVDTPNTPSVNPAVDPDPSTDNDNPVSATVTPDGPFENVKFVTLNEGVEKTIDSSLASAGTVDVYEIGPVETGDRVVVSATATGQLDPVLAVFDAAGDAMIVNDDRNYYGGNFNSAVDMQAHRDTDTCYVAVASSSGSNSSGEYSLSIRVSSGATVPDLAPQLVYLNFDGAQNIVIGQRAAVDIPVFEGTLLGEEFAGQTDELIDQTVARIRQDYIGIDVQFISSREGPPPSGAHTTIHFGAYDPGLLGLADYVDEFNLALTQKAVIFVDTFQAFLPLNPSVEEMANALSNVASHETGHLLGLNHSLDPQGVMDISANLRQMLASQAFLRSPLHPEVFPVGHQNAAQLLVEAVGGDLAMVKSAAADQLSMRALWYDEGEPAPARLSRPFSTCFCPTCAKHNHATRHHAEEEE